MAVDNLNSKIEKFTAEKALKNYQLQPCKKPGY